MTGLFFASILAGIIIAAPFGPAGALVADAGLIRDRIKLRSTIFAAALGNGLIAFLVSFFASPAKIFFEKYENIFFAAGGVFLIVLGAFMFRGASLSVLPIKKTASAAAVFFIIILHPGNIAAFIFVTAFLSMKFLFFSDHRLVFVSGITIGAFFAFGLAGALFWMLSEKAEKYMRQIRYGLAGFIVVTGIFLIIKSF